MASFNSPSINRTVPRRVYEAHELAPGMDSLDRGVLLALNADSKKVLAVFKLV